MKQILRHVTRPWIGALILVGIAIAAIQVPHPLSRTSATGNPTPTVAPGWISDLPTAVSTPERNITETWITAVPGTPVITPLPTATP